MSNKDTEFQLTAPEGHDHGNDSTLDSGSPIAPGERETAEWDPSELLQDFKHADQSIAAANDPKVRFR